MVFYSFRKNLVSNVSLRGFPSVDSCLSNKMIFHIPGYVSTRPPCLLQSQQRPTVVMTKLLWGSSFGHHRLSLAMHLFCFPLCSKPSVLTCLSHFLKSIFFHSKAFSVSIVSQQYDFELPEDQSHSLPMRLWDTGNSSRVQKSMRFWWPNTPVCESQCHLVRSLRRVYM